MFNHILCRIGLHVWRFSNAQGFSRGDGPIAVLYDADCQFCGKHQNRVMVL